MRTPTVIRGSAHAPSEFGVFISVVVCTCDSEQLRALASGLLQLFSLMPDRKMELVVVAPENLRADTEVLRCSTDLRIVFEPTVWGARGTSRNQGFRVSMGEWVYFLDQDVRISSDRMPKLSRVLTGLGERPENVCLVGGGYLNAPACSFWGKRYNWLANLWLENPAHGARFLAGNVAMKKEFFCRAPYDETLVDGGEEIELCERVLSAGGRVVFEPELALVHLADHSLERLWLRLTRHAQFKKRSVSRARLSFAGARVCRKALVSPSEWLGLFVHLAALGHARVVGART